MALPGRDERRGVWGPCRGPQSIDHRDVEDGHGPSRIRADMTDDLIGGDGLMPPAAYAREDESSDDEFYGFARKVVHIDDDAIAALGRLYAEVIPVGGRLLDLMSSWRSHLPEALHAADVVGLGM